MANFTIVHLSDLHLTGTDGARRTELGIFPPLKGMNQAFRRILASGPVRNANHVLITGDITDRGDLETWTLFWKIIREAGLENRLSIVPGNHDLCCLAARLPGKRRMYRTQDMHKAVLGLKMGQQPVTFPWACQPDPRLVIFGLNSNNLGNLNVATNALGWLGYYQLKALASKLYQFRHIPVKIIALHHSPNIPAPETAHRRGYQTLSLLERLGHQIPQEHRHALLLLALTHRVRLLVHGHLHRAEDRKISGIRIVGAPATTEPIHDQLHGCGYRFYTYTVQGSGGRVRCQLRTVWLGHQLIKES
ncbi:metallophosphoesterase [bacterium]|nr:metallophosphoesterase [bacterium]